MKKKIVLIAGLLVVLFLGWYAFDLMSKKGKSDEKIANFNFEIKDTSSITKIIISEPNGMVFELNNDGKTWTGKNGECVQPILVSNILKACYNIRFKGYIPDNGLKTVSNQINTLSIKVEFFQDGEWTKTWYVGTATPDHLGTYMQVETASQGKSDLPVIMEMHGMNGFLTPRFFADPRKWACTGIFSYEKEEISQVKVDFTGKLKTQSFSLSKKGKEYEIIANNQKIEGVPLANIQKYLVAFRRINFMNPNYELTNRQIDSVKRSTPFCSIAITDKKGKTKKVKCFRRKSESGEEEVDDFGMKSKYDINTFWCLTPEGEIVKAQYFVFNPIMMGHIYFGYKAPYQQEVETK